MWPLDAICQIVDGLVNKKNDLAVGFFFIEVLWYEQYEFILISYARISRTPRKNTNTSIFYFEWRWKCLGGEKKTPAHLALKKWWVEGAEINISQVK